MSLCLLDFRHVDESGGGRFFYSLSVRNLAALFGPFFHHRVGLIDHRLARCMITFLIPYI
jgi:hypothetical protein